VQADARVAGAEAELGGELGRRSSPDQVPLHDRRVPPRKRRDGRRDGVDELALAHLQLGRRRRGCGEPLDVELAAPARGLSDRGQKGRLKQVLGVLARAREVPREAEQLQRTEIEDLRQGAQVTFGAEAFKGPFELVRGVGEMSP